MTTKKWLLLGLVLSQTGALAEIGTIKSFDRRNVVYITEDKEYTIRRSRLAREYPEVEQYFSGINRNNLDDDDWIKYDSRQMFDFDLDKVSARLDSTDPRGVRPDCSEIPVSLDTVIDLGNKAQKGGMVEFLESIPPGTMQVFTMVHETQSLQHDGVSFQNPRIIRSTIDGKITMSFVCDKSSKDYGTVEIQAFDDETESFKYFSLDFSQEPDKLDENGKRVHDPSRPTTHYTNKHRVNEDPQSCMNCHSADPNSINPDPRPNWAEYPEWPGVYGSDDDRIERGSEEHTELVKLKENMADNPCFQSLPWPKEGAYREMDLYPYSSQFKSANYDIRPNFRLTDTLPRLATRRLGRKMFDHPAGENIKYLLAMNALSCPQVRNYDRAFRRAGLTNFDADSVGEGYGRTDPRSQPKTKRLMAVGKAMGFTESDWTLWFNREDEVEYHAPLSSGQAETIFQNLEADILRRLVDEHPELGEYYDIAPDKETKFGKNNACMDEMGGPIRLLHNSNRISRSQEHLIPDACRRLSALNDEHLGRRGRGENVKLPEKSVCEDPSVIPPLAPVEQLSPAVKAANADSVERGRDLAQMCIGCHTDDSGILPAVYGFFESEDRLKKQMITDSTLYSKAVAYVKSGRMPKGIPLEEQERQDIVNYLEAMYFEAVANPSKLGLREDPSCSTVNSGSRSYVAPVESTDPNAPSSESNTTTR